MGNYESGGLRRIGKVIGELSISYCRLTHPNGAGDHSPEFKPRRFSTVVEDCKS
ncbi:MAG UNVERIFIED_CONTAM: hypothetical protein LVR29_16290 [Microcystis novacekii LVE1205-3]